MKKIALAAALASLLALIATTGCSRTVYVEVPVPVEVKSKPKATPKPAVRHDNPDNFDAVQKPTTYSW